MNKINLLGRQYGSLTVIEEVDNDKFLCICVCGNKKEVWRNALKTTSDHRCKCRKSKNDSNKAALRRVWSGMKQRCYNKKLAEYRLYGARGIGICEEWLNSFGKFFEFAIQNGWEKGLHTDRIDVKGNYEPSNVRFVTPKESQRNKQNTVYIEINGETRSACAFAEDVELPSNIIYDRIKRGVPKNKLTEPVKKKAFIGKELAKQLIKVKNEETGEIQVHTSSGIQLSVKKRKDKDSYYVYHNRKQICLSDIPELSTETYPVYWHYVFGGGWERYSNFWYDKLLNNKH